MNRWGEEREEEPQKTQSHSHSCSFRSRPVMIGGITDRIKGLKISGVSVEFRQIKAAMGAPKQQMLPNFCSDNSTAITGDFVVYGNNLNTGVYLVNVIR